MQVRRQLLLNTNNPLPPMYKRVDWLETLGRQARINTEVPGNDSTLRLQCLFVPVVLNVNYHPLFGNAYDESYCVWRVITSTTASSAYSKTLLCVPGNIKQSSNVTIFPCGTDSSASMIGQKIMLDMEYGKITTTSGAITVTETRQTDTTAITNSRPIVIGSNNATGNTANTSKWHIYYFKIHSQGRLIRDYIPCIRKSDNKAGFYDTVNHTFNPSIGSVDFVAGYDN